MASRLERVERVERPAILARLRRVQAWRRARLQRLLADPDISEERPGATQVHQGGAALYDGLDARQSHSDRTDRSLVWHAPPPASHAGTGRCSTAFRPSKMSYRYRLHDRRGSASKHWGIGDVLATGSRFRAIKIVFLKQLSNAR